MVLLLMVCLSAHDWWSWHPPVGVWIGVLGLLGVVVPLIRDISKIGKGERAAWTFIMFALLLLEIKSVYQDRNEHDAEQRQARAESEHNFQTIADGIDKTIRESKQQFDTTITKEGQVLDTAKKVGELAQQNLMNVTGGDAYAVVEPVLTQRPDRDVPISIKNQGHNILTGVSVTLYVSGVWIWGTHDSIINSTENRIYGLTLHAGERLILSKQIKPEQFAKMKEDEGKGQADIYRVFVSIAAQNFTSDEYLDFKKNDKNRWSYIYKIYRQQPYEPTRKTPPPTCLLEQIDWSGDFNRPVNRRVGHPCLPGPSN